MAELRYDYIDWGRPEREARVMLEELRAFEHAKLIPKCPFKHPRWRPKKSVNYKYDPNKSDTLILTANPWR